MLIENDFVVRSPIGRVWAYVLDVEKVAPCMPGAQLTEVVDDTTWKGKVAVKLGPVSMSFAGSVVMQERDDTAHRVVLKADGREQRGRGAASALVTANLEAVDDDTRVSFQSEITITGAAAQYGRGMIQDISARLTKEFASCLQTNIAADAAAGVGSAGTEASSAGQDEGSGAAPTATTPATSEATAAAQSMPKTPTVAAPSQPAVRYVTAKPVKGIRLGLWALWRAILRFFGRVFGGRT